MRWTLRTRHVTLLLGVVGATLILLAFFLPYDTISYYSCGAIPPPCPLYPNARINWTWQEFFVLAKIGLFWYFPIAFFILIIPTMLLIRIMSFRYRHRWPQWEIVGRVIAIFGLFFYLLFDGIHFLAFNNLLPTMGQPPAIHATFAPGFWLPIVGFLLCLISTFTKSSD